MYHSPLHIAVKEGKIGAILLLIKLGANVNQSLSGSVGDTPLHIAVSNNDSDVVRILMRNGADPHIDNMLWNSAMRMADLRGYNDLVGLMKSYT